MTKALLRCTALSSGHKYFVVKESCTYLETEQVPLHDFVAATHGSQPLAPQQPVPRRNVVVNFNRGASFSCQV